MNKEKLIERKKQLEQNREMAIAQVQQIVGAIAMLDELINKPVETDKESDKTELKKTA